MDFPLFFADPIGNRLLMALTAVTHVLINHSFAIGAYPLLVYLEWKAFRTQDESMDEALYRINFVIFIITTTFGALTGVGIWWVAGVVSPSGIGNLLRIFFWAWLIEWFVFITEIALVLAYVLQWKKMKTHKLKRRHIWLGVWLAAFSWITMVIITGILGFMLDSGGWSPELPPLERLLNAFFGDLYLPQLLFRTAFAGFSGGVALVLLSGLVKDLSRRIHIIKSACIWSAAWFVPMFAFLGWYWSCIPQSSKHSEMIALWTQKYLSYSPIGMGVVVIGIATVLIFLCFGVFRPKKIPIQFWVIPLVISFTWLAHFERTREFLRKPYLIPGYLYSNGISVADTLYFREKGMLPHAAFMDARQTDAVDPLMAGRSIFKIACAQCHTLNGVNGLIRTLNQDSYTNRSHGGLTGETVRNMHISKPFMPPFPGTKEEAEALVLYLRSLNRDSEAHHESKQSELNAHVRKRPQL